MVETNRNVVGANNDEVSWLESIPLATRKRRAMFWLSVPLALAIWLAYSEWQNGLLGKPESLWVLVLSGAGIWLYRTILNDETIRRFQTVEIVLSKRERARRASPLWVLGFGGMILTWWMQFHFNALSDDWLFGLGFSPFALIGLFIYAYLRKETKLTIEGQKMKTYYAAEALKKRSVVSKYDEQIEKLFKKKGFRYPLAAGLLWAAYEWSLIDRPKMWIWVAGAILCALAAAHELALWLLGAGLVVGLLLLGFQGIAALPVSVAVIIGALIIASALK